MHPLPKSTNRFLTALIFIRKRKKESLFKWWNIESTQKMTCTFHRSDIMALLEKGYIYINNETIDNVMSISSKSN